MPWIEPKRGLQLTLSEIFEAFAFNLTAPSHNINKILTLAVFDEPVELCVTLLRYTQIHGFFSRSVVQVG